MRKFMGRQDELAVVAAARAVEAAALAAAARRTLRSVSVGGIHSLRGRGSSRCSSRPRSTEGRFSMERFSDDGVSRAEPAAHVPLPAEHAGVSRLAEFRHAGAVLVSYPGTGQFYSRSKKPPPRSTTARSTSRWSAASPTRRTCSSQHHFSRIDATDSTRARSRRRRLPRPRARRRTRDRRGAAWRARPIACEMRTSCRSVRGLRPSRGAHGGRGASCDVAALGPASLAVALVDRVRWHADAYGSQPRWIRGLERMGGRVRPPRRRHRHGRRRADRAVRRRASVDASPGGPLRRRADPIFDPAALPTRIAAEVEMDGRRSCATARCRSPSRRRARLSTMRRRCGSTPEPEGGLSLGIGLELFSMDDASRSGAAAAAAGRARASG